jgi:hypothetical protein
MNVLPEAHRPKSEDPEFWAVWSGTKDRNVDWKTVADDWQQISPVATGEVPAETTGTSD